MSFLLKKIPHRMVRPTSHPHVFRLEIHPLSILGYQSDLVSWLNFIQDMAHRFPFVLLWLNDLYNSLMAEIGESVSSNGTARFFRMAQEHDSKFWLEKLDEGGWAMFFYDKPPDEISLPPKFLPTDPEAVFAVLNEVNAEVVIVSWYDNDEWIIAFTNDLTV